MAVYIEDVVFGTIDEARDLKNLMVLVFYSLGTVDRHTLTKGFNRGKGGEFVCNRIHAYVDE